MSSKATKKAVGDSHAPAEAKAVLDMLRTSPIKLNQVARMIRGLPVEEALIQLTFCSRRIAVDVRKALQSAIANAENNHDMDIDTLVVAEAYVGKSFMMKRIRPRARGRAARIHKPSSRLTIVVREQSEKEEKR